MKNSPFLTALYSNPWRVYLILALISCFGIWAALHMPVSLYPNSQQPQFRVTVNYGNLSSVDFKKSYGNSLEETLRTFDQNEATVTQVTGTYFSTSADYSVRFKWGQDSQKVEDQLQTKVTSFVSSWPRDIRESLSVGSFQDSGGFLAISFFSASREPKEIYPQLEDLLRAKMSSLSEIGSFWLQNPEEDSILVRLNMDDIIRHGIAADTVRATLEQALESYQAGKLTLGENTLIVQVPSKLENFEDFGRLLIPLPKGGSVPLGSIANIQQPKAKQTTFKTSGNRSLILFASPKPGGNVKKMAEDILRVIAAVKPQFAPDIEMKELVDPSSFIRSATTNVVKEVAIGAVLASVILFLFIGSLKNVVTAAIEIPTSLLLAFLLMKFSGMSLNLISLGGLALSAGMNVDASVVVMENIFRKFESATAQLSIPERLQLIIEAVKEVWLPVVAATISSLVVFLPLIFTSDLSYAILGDLAKAVVFSHGFSCIVALILVPTVRFHLIKNAPTLHLPPSPLEGFWTKVESFYASSLKVFASRSKLVFIALVSLMVGVGALGVFVLPKLPLEIVGLPETDFVMARISNVAGVSSTEFEENMDKYDSLVREKLSYAIDYSFAQIWGGGNGGWVLFRVKQRNQYEDTLSQIEKLSTDTPIIRFRVQAWNPSELPIPNPPQLEIQVQGGEPADQLLAANDVSNWLKSTELFPRIDGGDVDLNPGKKTFVWKPYQEMFASGIAVGALPGISEILTTLRLASDTKSVGTWTHNSKTQNVSVGFKEDTLKSYADLSAFPVLNAEGNIVSLSTLGNLSIEQAPPTINSVNGETRLSVMGRFGKGKEREGREALKKAKALFPEWQTSQKAKWASGIRVNFVDAERDIKDAITQLSVALLWSIGAIFLILILQFGSFLEALLVLVAVPLGFAGVFLSLWIFRSTLSLNSMLGVILLNGLAVGNSILLVDLMNQLHAAGKSPLQAACEAASKRLRPILITSLTTILGMLPIALGLGEGGKVLQPLGISVAGGLWVSMLLTLFIVPALHVVLLTRKDKKLLKVNGRLEQSSSTLSTSAKVTLFLLLILPEFLQPNFGSGFADSLNVSETTNTSSATATSVGTEVSAHKNIPRQQNLLTSDLFVDWVLTRGERSFKVQTARHYLESAQAKETDFNDSFLPQVNSNARTSRNGSQTSFGIPGIGNQNATFLNQMSVGINAESNLYNGGKDQVSTEATKLYIEKEQLKIQHIMNEEALKYAELAFDWLLAKGTLEILNSRLGLLSQQLEVANLRYNKGMLPAQDVEKVAQGINKAKLELLDSKQKVENIQILIGSKEAQDLTSWPFLIKPSLKLTDSNVSLIGKEVTKTEANKNEFKLGVESQKTPQILSLDAEIALSKLQLEQLDASKKPKLNVGTEVSRAWQSNPSQGNKLNPKTNVSVYASLEWNLWDPKTGQNERESLLKTSEAKRFEKMQTSLELEQEFRQLSELVAYLNVSHSSHKSLIKGVESNLETSKARFLAGRISVNDLLADERDLNEERLQYLNILQRWHVAHFKLCLLKISMRNLTQEELKECLRS